MKTAITMKKIITTLAGMLLAAVFSVSMAQNQPHVFINPGHGGHDSDDRNVVIPPFTQGDTLGFWESNSNLWKGFALQEILRKKGYKTSISRIKNTTADDLPLSTIVALSNSSGADVFYSIHSNASGHGEAYAVNFPMGFYRGYTNQPENPNSMLLLSKLAPYIIDNKSTVWSQDKYQEWGDWSFQPGWGTQGYGVLRGNRIAAILDEGSFHDYYPEAYRLLNHEYCWVEGFSFSLGADDYFGRLDLFGEGLVTGTIRDDRLLRTDIRTMIGADKRVPVNGALVRLLDSGGNVVDEYTTDNLRNGIYLFKYVAPGTYTVEVSHPDYFGKSAEVVVNANAKTYQNFDLKRQRNTPPEVVNYSPVWKEGDAPVRCNEPLKFEFNWDMDAESVEQAFTIDPPVEGTIQWEDANYRMTFTPNDAYQVDTRYTVTIGKSAKHGGGTEMVEDFVLQFDTQSRNHIFELAMFPREGSRMHYKSANVEFRTDSLIEAYDAFNYMHVIDKDGNEVGWNKRSLKFNEEGDDYGYLRFPLSKDLTVGEDYRVVVDVEMKDTMGLKLEAPIEYHFTAVDAAETTGSPAVVEPFEAATGFALAAGEGDTPVGTVKVTASSTKLFGSKSLQLAYEFAGQNEGDEMVIDAPASEEHFTRNDALVLHIFGDMSFNHFYARLTNEAGTDDRWVDLGVIDFVGWQRVVVDNLKDVLAADENYSFTGMKMVKNATKMGRKGTMRVDNLLKDHSTGVSETTLAGVTVGPNPAVDYVVASAGSFVTGMELINSAGQTVARNGSNFINVSGVTPGVYLVRVYTNGMTSTHKVMVAR